MSDSLELEDFAIGLASSVVNLLEGQVKSWENWNYKSTVRLLNCYCFFLLLIINQLDWKLFFKLTWWSEVISFINIMMKTKQVIS